MQTLLQDLRCGMRLLLKNPGFTLVAVVTLALGVGATSAMFTVTNAVLFRSLPVRDPERLVMLWEKNPRGIDRNDVSPPNFKDWQEQSRTFEDIVAFVNSNFNVTGAAEPERLTGQEVSSGFFPLLGVTPILGRVFSSEEEQVGGDRSIILSHGLWQRRFGSDPNALGQRLTLNGIPFAVIGVMPAGFQPLIDQADLWTPFTFNPREISRNARFLRVIGRLKPETTPAEVRAEMAIIAGGIEQQFPRSNNGYGVTIVPLHEQVVGGVKTALLIFFGAVGLVLLIACANVANLLLMRATTRQKEIAIRAALGAGRFRLIRQLLAECVPLALIGGGLGLLLAFWGVDLLVAFGPDSLPRLGEIAIDLQALTFTLLVSLLTGAVFGLVPALQFSRIDLAVSLKEGDHRSAGSSGRSRLRGALVVGEVALALVLLAASGLLIKSLWRLQNVHPGFRAQNALTMDVSLLGTKYADRQKQAAFFEEVIQGVETIPGVEAAGAISRLPMTGGIGFSRFGFTIEDAPPLPPDQSDRAYVRWISPSYFQALGIPLRTGRDFDGRDRAGAAPVVIIDATLAARFFTSENPIGKRLRISYTRDLVREIVGVVGEVRQTAMEMEAAAHIYVPYLQEPVSSMAIVARTTPEPMTLASSMRGQVLAADKDQPISNLRSMEQLLDDTLAQRRFNMLLLAIFATVALVLAMIGIFGVVSYGVTQRTREIGIRMALGARTGDVLKLMVKRGMALTLIGVMIGLAVALGLTHLMASLLFEVSATDPLTFATIGLLLTLVALPACYIPARRATKVDPMAALRRE